MDIITLFPVRCITCNKVLGDKQQSYERLIKARVSIRDALDTLGLHRICCRQSAISAIQIPVPTDIPAESAIETRSGLLRNPLLKVGEWVLTGQPLRDGINKLNPDEAQQINRILERLTQLLSSNPKLAIERLIQANQPLATAIAKLELKLPILILPSIISKDTVIDQLFFNLNLVPNLSDLLGIEFMKVYDNYQDNPEVLAETMLKGQFVQEEDFFKSVYLTTLAIRDDPSNIIQKFESLLVPGGPAIGIIERFIKANLTFDQALTLLGMDAGITIDLSSRHSATRILENIMLLTPFYESILTDLKIVAREGQIGTGLEDNLERMSLQHPIMSTPGGALDAMTNRGNATSIAPGPGPSSKPVATGPIPTIPRMPTRSRGRMPGRPASRPVPEITPTARPPIRMPGVPDRPLPTAAPAQFIIPAARPSVPAVPTAVASSEPETSYGASKMELPPVPRLITLPTLTEFGLPIYRAV